MRNPKQLLTLFISAGLLILLLPLSVWGIDYLSNAGLEAPFVPYGDYNGWELQVANGWEKFIVEENTYNDGSRLRFFSASDWAAFNGSPVTERVEGAEAQVWWSSSTKKFDAGIYQQVTGLTVGETYGFQAGVLQVFETSNRGDPATGMMSRRWGVDPTGGVSPTSTTVIWSPAEQHAAYSDGGQKYTWFWGSVGAEALSTTMTIFVRVSSVGGGSTPHSDQVWTDDAFFDIAPTTALTVALTGPTEAQAQWSGAPRAGFTAYASEAQYRRLTATTWTDLQIFDVLSPSPPTAVSAVFPVQEGGVYLVRARTWHERDVNGRTHQVAGPWTEKTITVAAQSQINGVVIDNQGKPFPGVTVAVTGQSLTDNTAGDGSFSFTLPPGDYTLTAANASGWQTRKPVSITALDTQPVSVTLTVIPPDDVIVNGTFEDGLNGWQSTFTQPGGTMGSGYLGAGLVITQNGSLSQTGSVANAYKPTLTFWYKIEGGDGVSSLTARVFGRPTLTPTQSLVFTSSTGGWQRAILPLNLAEFELGTGGSLGTPILPVPNTYSGVIGVNFTASYSGAGNLRAVAPIFSLDEVVLGSSQPEPAGGVIYLPIVLRNYAPPTPPTPEPTCPTTSTRTFALIPVPGPPADHPDYLHGDLNLELRGYEPVVGPNLGLEDGSGGDSDPPQLPGLFADSRVPTFSAAYQVYDWTWNPTADPNICNGNPHGCRGSLLTNPETTLIGMQTSQGEEIKIPTRNSEIYGGGYKVLVLYAAEKRITLSYLREDTVANGYSVQIENVCVDPNLLALYRSRVDENGERITSDGLQLPALRNGDTLGTALSDEMPVAIRDRGKYWDPRTRGDWWRGH